MPIAALPWDLLQNIVSYLWEINIFIYFSPFSGTERHVCFGLTFSSKRQNRHLLTKVLRKYLFSMFLFRFALKVYLLNAVTTSVSGCNTEEVLIVTCHMRNASQELEWKEASQDGGLLPKYRCMQQMLEGCMQQICIRKKKTQQTNKQKTNPLTPQNTKPRPTLMLYSHLLKIAKS